jgi:glutaredoxin-like protein NrdH
MTYKVLDSRGILYKIIDITEDEGAREYVMNDLGYLQAPVVVTEDDHWSGFRPDKIEQIEAA